MRRFGNETTPVGLPYTLESGQRFNCATQYLSAISRTRSRSFLSLNVVMVLLLIVKLGSELEQRRRALVGLDMRGERFVDDAASFVEILALEVGIAEAAHRSDSALYLAPRLILVWRLWTLTTQHAR